MPDFRKSDFRKSRFPELPKSGFFRLPDFQISGNPLPLGADGADQHWPLNHFSRMRQAVTLSLFTLAKDHHALLGKIHRGEFYIRCLFAGFSDFRKSGESGILKIRNQNHGTLDDRTLHNRILDTSTLDYIRPSYHIEGFPEYAAKRTAQAHWIAPVAPK